MQLLTDYYKSEQSGTEVAINVVSAIATKMASVHDVVFHFDNSTGPFVDKICNQTGIYYDFTNFKNQANLPKTNYFHHQATNVIYFLNNFGNKGSRSKKMTDYMRARNLLHIVVLPNALDFEKIFLLSVRSENSVLYVCINQRNINTSSCINQYYENNFNNALNSSMFLSNTFLRRVFLVMVLEVIGNFVRLFEICYFCGNDAQKMTLRYESKTLEQDDFKLTYLLSNVTKEVEFNYNDFSSHVLRVAFPHGHFYVGCLNEINIEIGDDIFTECGELIGVEGVMLKEISDRLNFRFAFVNPKNHKEEGIWKNMVIDVVEHKVDFAISSILISESRLKRVDFSSTVGNDPLRIVYMSRPNVLDEG